MNRLSVYERLGLETNGKMAHRFEIVESKLPGCVQINPLVLSDERGLFIKTFHEDEYAASGIELPMTEEYFSVSRQGVLRGMHFQVPPKQGSKLVCCVSGKVVDAVVDLRVGSPKYGKFDIFELNGEQGNMVYIPVGLAHGFYALTPGATLLYKVGSVYSPEYDSGIHWASAGIPWPDSQPVVSQRDQGFLTLSEFQSPFKF